MSDCRTGKGRPFVDTHIHFHDMTHPRLRYEWLEFETPIDPVLGDDAAIRSKRYWADDFVAETRFQNVKKVIHVQAAIGSQDPVEETSWLQSFYERVGIPHGIIGYLDLAGPDVERQLDRHKAFANFRGVRDLRYDDYLSNSDWRRGFALLDGLVCCADPFIEEMHLAREVAEDNAGVTLCIDHGGYPEHVGSPRRHDPDSFAIWRDGMREISRAPNTVVKISGLGQFDHRWTSDSIKRWALTCIELFGIERSFFGTNWPVDRLYSSYGDVLDAFETVLADFSEVEKDALFSQNAERIFSI